MSNPNQSTYTGPERRTRPREREWREGVDRRFADGAQTMRELRTELSENTAATKQMQTDVGELVSLMHSFQGAMRVLEMLGRAAKPLGYIVMLGTALAGLWTALKGGVPK